MEFLKMLFDGKALTYEELAAAAEAAGIKAANLAEGGYVHLEKFKRLEGQCRQLRAQLLKLQQQGEQPQEPQLEELQQQARQAQERIQVLEGQLAAQQLESQVDLALVGARARNVRAARALLDLQALGRGPQEEQAQWQQRIAGEVARAAEENPFLFGSAAPPPPARASAKWDGEAARWREEAGLGQGDMMKGE